MTRTLTAGQMTSLATQTSKLIEQVLSTQDVMQEYPTLADGSKDFRASLVSRPVSRDDVAFLITEYFNLRMSGTSHGDASRVTYGCCYRQSDVRFNPHARIAEMRSAK